MEKKNLSGYIEGGENIAKNMESQIMMRAQGRSSLVNKILSKATSRQLERARMIVGSKQGVYGWSSAEDDIRSALLAFDRRNYGDCRIARFLNKDDLELAMSDKEFRIDRAGYPTTRPKQKQWDCARGGWYED